MSASAGTTPTRREARARLAILTRHHGAQAPITVEARRTLAAVNLETYVRRVVDAAPPLTDDQKARIVAALGGAR